MTSSTIQLYRTIVVADIVMLSLYPAIDWRGHLRRFLRDLSIDLLQQAVREPLTSPYTGFRLARAPMAAADTIEWVVRRLPDIGRQTLRTLSAGERLIPHALRLLRRAVGAGDHRRPRAGGDQARRLLGERVRGRFVLRIADNPWPAVTIGVLTALVLSSFIRRLEA